MSAMRKNVNGQMRRLLAALCTGAAVFAVLLCACSIRPSETEADTASVPEIAVTATPVPTPAPTPEPTPEPTPPPVEVTLTGSGPEEILGLMDVENLVYVDASASTCYAELMQLRQAKPECIIDYFVDLGGVTVGSRDESADIQGVRISVPELKEKLQYLPELKSLDMCSLGYTNEQSLEIVEAYPDIDITWTVKFAKWSVRSDIQSFSTLQDIGMEHRYTTTELAPLFEYCTELRALDLGHNYITDLEPIRNLKKLQALIIGDSLIKDISPLGDLTELRYLEMFLGYNVEDFTPLNNLTKMIDINVCFCSKLTNLDFLEYMPDLKTCWSISTGLTREQTEQIKEKYPDVQFLFYGTTSVNDGWRATDRNVAVRKAFVNWRNVVAFNSWDDVEYVEGVYIIDTKPIY